MFVQYSSTLLYYISPTPGFSYVVVIIIAINLHINNYTNHFKITSKNLALLWVYNAILLWDTSLRRYCFDTTF